MTINNGEQYVYIILSQTGSIVSKWLKMVTKDEYNHVSLSLDKELNEMCSFGRYYAYFPFWGGFVHESTKMGALKRFKNTTSKIVRIKVNNEQIDSIRKKINEMFSSKKKYRYDMLGVVLASMHVDYRRNYRYYCSEFVKEILINNGVINKEECPKIMKPMDFLKLSNVEEVYTGKLHEYLK